jgi:hypothetical protein
MPHISGLLVVQPGSHRSYRIESAFSGFALGALKAREYIPPFNPAGGRVKDPPSGFCQPLSFTFVGLLDGGPYHYRLTDPGQPILSL